MSILYPFKTLDYLCQNNIGIIPMAASSLVPIFDRFVVYIP